MKFKIDVLNESPQCHSCVLMLHSENIIVELGPFLSKRTAGKGDRGGGSDKLHNSDHWEIEIIIFPLLCRRLPLKIFIFISSIYLWTTNVNHDVKGVELLEIWRTWELEECRRPQVFKHRYWNAQVHRGVDNLKKEFGNAYYLSLRDSPTWWLFLLPILRVTLKSIWRETYQNHQGNVRLLFCINI